MDNMSIILQKRRSQETNKGKKDLEIISNLRVF